MIRDHIVKDEAAGAPDMSTFQASDLVVLRILAGMSREVVRERNLGLKTRPAACVAYNSAFHINNQEARMAKLGFLGLGIMGYPMARNLITRRTRCGALVEYGRQGAAVGAIEKGGDSARPRRRRQPTRNASSFASATARCPRISSSGRTASLKGAKAGAVVVDASTVSPSASRAIGSKLAKSGFHFLDAPCTGSKPGAEGGTLTFMIGGDQEVFERVKPLLRADGQAAVLLWRARHGAARQADPESDPFQHPAGVQRRHGARAPRPESTRSSCWRSWTTAPPSPD